MAKVLSSESATQYLEQKGIKIGLWNRLEPLHKINTVQSTFCTGKSVYELINISRHVAGWLANGSWKILQIDNSSAFYECEWVLLCSLLFGPNKQIDLMSHQTFLFEFGCGKTEDFQTEVLLAHLIFFMLVQEAHCYLISSGGKNGEMLAVQDGFIYFYGDDNRLIKAKKLLDDLEADPTKPAFWVYPE